MEKVYEKLRDISESELKKIAKKDDLSPAEFEAAAKAVCMLKDLKKIEDMDSKRMMGDDYSHGYGHYEHPYRRYGIVSYADGNRTRDRMGRYSNSDGRMYSHHSIKDRMIDRLESMMDEASTDYERQKVGEFIRQIEMTE